jgi:Ca-activated chloride channel family protein
VPLVGLVAGRAAWLRHRARQQLAAPEALPRLIPPTPWPRRLSWPLACAAVVAAIVAAAGPRWGRDTEAIAGSGRDLVIVLDVSRSMYTADMADAPSRLAAARLALDGLLEALLRHGGDRVGLVVFAGRPLVLAPLTADLRHVQQCLLELDTRLAPGELDPPADAARSGTRIGAAVAAATELLASSSEPEQQRLGWADVLLVSDGDDPAQADGEYRQAITAARQCGRVGVPVQAVGLGNPDPSAARPVEVDGVPITFAGKVVTSRLHEELLRSIAQATGGTYLPAQRQTPDLAEFYASTIRPQGNRELLADQVAAYRDRSGIFIGLAWGLAVASIGCASWGWRGERSGKKYAAPLPTR